MKRELNVKLLLEAGMEPEEVDTFDTDGDNACEKCGHLEVFHITDFEVGSYCIIGDCECYT